MNLCKGGGGICTEQAEADGYCDAHHLGPASTLPGLVSADAERRTCTTETPCDGKGKWQHPSATNVGECSQPCAMCHAEEIARITAECYQNARGRDDALAVVEREHKKNNALGAELKAVRAAHERTKAELEQAQHRLNDADGALQDAGTPVVDERFDAAIQRLHAERDAARSERDSHLQRYTRTREHLDTAQAEAAATLIALTLLWEWGSTVAFSSDIGQRYLIVAKSVIGNPPAAGRALAARVSLLEAVAKAAAHWAESRGDDNDSVVALLLAVRQLVALDEKDGGS